MAPCCDRAGVVAAGGRRHHLAGRHRRHLADTTDVVTPYYDEAGITIYHADCREVLPTLGVDIDLLLADPPYNVGCAYDEYNDSREQADYEVWSQQWWDAAQIATNRQVVFPGHGNLGMWHRLSGLSGVMRKPSGIGCWYKPGNPAGGGVFQHCEWEPFLLYGAAKGIPDVIRATVNHQFSVGTHPCPKPLLLYRTILAKGRAESVIDPFAGSGTTLRAAKDLGIRGVGIEISEAYCEIAAKRLAQEVLAL